ncbi:MAG: cyclopropane-fatty-acyl-phospholipid synthase family protein [Desulfobacterales bacterium]|nr:cyclopropane-fatty-acyl-phospholipid synthase family protein [Desulfobacterales bacterium]
MSRSSASERYASIKNKTSVSEKWSRTFVLKMFARIKYGQITLQEGSDHRTFGSDPSLKAHIIVRNPGFYKKVLFGGSIGAGEAYVDHLWDVDDLTQLVRIMVRNMDLLDSMEQGFAWFLRPYRRIRHALNINNRQGAKRNILSHYDLGNEMYKTFLDPTMMYSSAIYPNEQSTLKEASLNKLETICRKIDLNPADRVIEIGTGWGGFAIYAARNYGCHVTTTTISDAQYKEAEIRIAEAGLTERITLLKQDYRDLTGQFDKLVSIEMIEAVGDRYLPEFFRKCGNLLNEKGVMLLQAITIKDQKYEQYVHTVDFLQRHIFPGGCVLSNSRMIDLIFKKTDMVVRHLEDFGFDYARTLKDWRTRFNENFQTLKDKGYDETFRRLWEFYLCYCEGGFLERPISVVHLITTRPANRECMKSI